MTDPAAQPPAGWENILTPGETILWQGRPKQGIAWGKRGPYHIPIGFERLTEPDTVHGLIRKIQKDDT